MGQVTTLLTVAVMTHPEQIPENRNKINTLANNNIIMFPPKLNPRAEQIRLRLLHCYQTCLRMRVRTRVLGTN